MADTNKKPDAVNPSEDTQDSSKASTVGFVIDKERRKNRGVDPKVFIKEIKSYSYPEQRHQITEAITQIENGTVRIDAEDLNVLISNLAKWAREARDDSGFLQRIASCARKMDDIGIGGDVDVFFTLWKIVPRIANSINDCKKVINTVIDTHNSDDYGLILQNLLPFFQQKQNYQELPGFFEIIFPEEERNNRDLVSLAWNTLLCDEKINGALKAEAFFSKPHGRKFAKTLWKHSDGRKIPSALAEDKKKRFFTKVKIGICAAAVVVFSVVAVIIASVIRDNAIDPSTIVIDYPTEITINYGEALDFGGRFITYKLNNGSEKQIPITDANIRGLNNLVVGRNNPVTIEYKGKTHNVTVKVNPIVLSTPSVKLSGGAIVWSSVAASDKCDYVFVLKDAEGNQITSGDVAVVEGVYSSILPESLAIGSYSVLVTAVSKTSEYADSQTATFSFEKKAGVANVRYENKRIVWDSVSGAKGYTVLFKGDQISVANGNSLECALEGGVNELFISVVYDGNVVFEKTQFSISKKETPSVNIENGIIYVADDVVLKIGTTEFDENELDSHTVNPGKYTITAQVLATQPGELDSDIVTVEITRLPKPNLAIKDNALRMIGQEGYEAKYLIKAADNGTYAAFDGNILDFENPGQYFVKAQFIGKSGAEYVLPSVESDEVSFTKLPTPTVKQDGSGIRIENGAAQYELYVNGALFNGDISALPSGFYEITARNIGDGVTTISSAQSDTEVKVGKIENTTITISTINDGKAIRVTVTPDFDTSKYPVKLRVKFVKHTGETQTEETKTYEDTYTFVYIVSGAESIDVMITVMYSGFEDIPLETKTWTAN